MPRHGQLWRWAPPELDRAAILLSACRQPFTMFDMYRVAHEITMVRVHGQGLRNALLMTGRIVVVNRTNPRKYFYRVTDGQQAQRPTSAAD